MKVLLVGGKSTLARALHPVLASFAEVLTAGRNGCSLELDLCWDADRVVVPTGLDAVIHLAAHFGGRDVHAMLAAEDVNVRGSLKLAAACKRAKVSHLVQISTIFAGLAETSPFFSSYALSKRHAEELTSLYCDSSGIPLTILRPAQLYGEGDDFRKHQPFVYALMDLAERGENIVIQGSHDALRNFIHVDDVAAVLARVVKQRVLGRYVCAGLSNVSFSEIAAAAQTAFGSTGTVSFDATKPDIPDNSFTADETLYRLIDYTPRISLVDGFAREAARRRALR